MAGARLTFLQYEGNVIFRVDAPGPVPITSKKGSYIVNRYVLRILTTSDMEAVASELIWLAALSRNAGLLVPEPVPTLDGKLLTTITTPGAPHGRIVSLMRWIDGRRLTNWRGYAWRVLPESAAAEPQAVSPLRSSILASKSTSIIIELEQAWKVESVR